jgi:two-component system, NtrC family, response regulator AlgB
MLTESRPSSQAISAPQLRVIVLTPDARLFVLLSNSLRSHGCQVTRTTTLASAVQVLRAAPHDVLLLDVARDGEQPNWVSALLAENYSLRIIAVTDADDLSGVVKCLRAGVHDCIRRPIDLTQLHQVLHVPYVREETVSSISTSSCMRLAMDGIRRAALSDLPVMLRGEHGTGKTMFAEHLHRLSRRANGPFVTVNCPSLSAELATSELFGHRKGSFTGAVGDQIGKVESAEGGSLFLDELGDLPLAVQARILRFLQDRAFERLGDTVIRFADVRLITATNRNLEALIAAGDFRPDLFYRLSGIEIIIPPLRERRSDIVALAQQFLRSHSHKHGRELQFSQQTIDILASYDWPGNVRELSNEIQRAVVMTAGPFITPDDLSLRLRSAPADSIYLGGDFTLRQITDQHVMRVLMRHPYVGQVARVLDIERSTLLNKRRRLGVRPGRAKRVEGAS